MCTLIRVKVFTVIVVEEVFLVDEIYAKKGGDVYLSQSKHICNDKGVFE